MNRHVGGRAGGIFNNQVGGGVGGLFGGGAAKSTASTATLFHPAAGDVILRDTAVYCGGSLGCPMQYNLTTIASAELYWP